MGPAMPFTAPLVYKSHPFSHSNLDIGVRQPGGRRDQEFFHLEKKKVQKSKRKPRELCDSVTL